MLRPLIYQSMIMFRIRERRGIENNMEYIHTYVGVKRVNGGEEEGGGGKVLFVILVLVDYD